MTGHRPAALRGAVLVLLLGGGDGAGLPAARAATSPVPSAPFEESFVLPPYLESVVLDVRGGGRDDGVEILPPGAGAGSPLAPGCEGVDEVRLWQHLRTLIVRHPAPGWWRVRKAQLETRVEIRAERFMPRGRLLAPGKPGPARRFDRVAVTYQVTDQNGEPLAELSGYPLTCEAVLVDPGGRRLRLRMDRRPPRQLAIFRARRRPRCNLPGRYWTEVMVTVRDLVGRRVTVLADRWSGFRVAARRP